MDARMAQYPQINVTHHINKMKAKNHMIISMAAKKKKKSRRNFTINDKNSQPTG